MSDIHFILTGGTIDSFYYPPKVTTIPLENSVIPNYLQQVVNPHIKARFDTLCMLDSKDINDKERNSLVKAINESESSQIVICHGTDTMVETQNHLSEKLGNTDKTIVITGSMIPLKEFAQSDAGFNLGYAVAQVQTLKPGVYICMNAKSFPAGTVVKNFEQARFEDNS